MPVSTQLSVCSPGFHLDFNLNSCCCQSMRLCWQITVITYVTFYSVTDCSAINPVTNCVEYVPEEEDHSCSCLPPEDFTGDATYSWPGHSTTPQLTLRKVSRQDTGTEYTCSTTTGGSSTSTVYTLNVAYGPYDELVQVTPTVIPTNGSVAVTLTCSADDVYPPPTIVWDNIECINNKGSTCTFTPKKPFIQTRATCIVSRRLLDGFSGKASIKIAKLSYNCPPEQPPVIISPVATDQLLKTGHKLTCTVTGGDPRVDLVQFNCLNPVHVDQSDELNTTTASSAVTINSRQATETAMTCVCSANWSMAPELYPLETKVTYFIELRALVKNLTLNGKAEELTVNEVAHVTVQLLCETYARPAALDVNISKMVNATPGRLQGQAVSTTGKWTSEKKASLSGVQYYDMGSYVCTASNGLWETDQRSVLLKVNSKPRKFSDVDLGNADNGVSFKLAAYPVPNNFTFFHLGNQKTGKGTEVTSSRFFSSCLQDAVIMYMVNCRIVPASVPASLLGSYRASVSNGLGSVELLFSVQKEVPEPAEPEDSNTFGIIIGVTIFLALVVMAVVAGQLYIRGKQQKPPDTLNDNIPVEQNEAKSRTMSQASEYSSRKPTGTTTEETTSTHSGMTESLSSPTDSQSINQ